jgi:hypothetical protein
MEEQFAFGLQKKGYIKGRLPIDINANLNIQSIITTD